jgi:molecular chaperone Hsp33
VNPDTTSKFVFEAADCRGEVVHLDQAYREVLDIHQYPPPVAQLLGEFLAAAVLLSTTIKFEGRLILQAQSKAQVALLMAECSNAMTVRAIARGTDGATSAHFHDLLEGGHLAITIEPDRGRRYQGIVALDGGDLASSIESYFRSSEQLPTRLWLASDGSTAAGLLLQLLPDQVSANADEKIASWQHLTTLAGTVTGTELLRLDQAGLLTRLFAEDPLRLFRAQPVRFACSCSRERCLEVLRSLDPAEIEEILEDEGAVSMDCEFCTQQYRFGRGELQGDSTPLDPHFVH